MSDAFLPLSQSDRDYYINKIDVLLPKGYLELTQETEGVNLDGGACCILGVSEVFVNQIANMEIYTIVSFPQHGIIGVSNKGVFYISYKEQLVSFKNDFFDALGYGIKQNKQYRTAP